MTINFICFFIRAATSVHTVSRMRADAAHADLSLSGVVQLRQRFLGENRKNIKICFHYVNVKINII